MASLGAEHPSAPPFRDGPALAAPVAAGRRWRRAAAGACAAALCLALTAVVLSANTPGGSDRGALGAERGGALAELLQQALQEATGGNATQEDAGGNATQGSYARVRTSAYEAFMEAMVSSGNSSNETARPPRQVPPGFGFRVPELLSVCH